MEAEFHKFCTICFVNKKYQKKYNFGIMESRMKIKKKNLDFSIDFERWNIKVSDNTRNPRVDLYTQKTFKSQLHSKIIFFLRLDFTIVDFYEFKSVFLSK